MIRIFFFVFHSLPFLILHSMLDAWKYRACVLGLPKCLYRNSHYQGDGVKKEGLWEVLELGGRVGVHEWNQWPHKQTQGRSFDHLALYIEKDLDSFYQSQRLFTLWPGTTQLLELQEMHVYKMFIHVYKFMSISHFVRLSQTVYYRQIFELFLFLNSSLKSWAICLYAPLFLPMNSFLFGMDSVSFICKKPFSRFFSFFHISVSSEWCYE